MFNKIAICLCSCIEWVLAFQLFIVIDFRFAIFPNCNLTACSWKVMEKWLKCFILTLFRCLYLFLTWAMLFVSWLVLCNVSCEFCCQHQSMHSCYNSNTHTPFWLTLIEINHGSYASWEILETWKVLDNQIGTGNSWKLKCSVPESPGI